jgi:hypothetical protein
MSSEAMVIGSGQTPSEEPSIPGGGLSTPSGSTSASAGEPEGGSVVIFSSRLLRILDWDPEMVRTQRTRNTVLNIC